MKYKIFLSISVIPGFTIFLFVIGIYLGTLNADEASAKDEARVDIQDGTLAYSNAEVVVKLGGWDDGGAQPAAEACLSALKQLLWSDKELTGKKSLYIRLGCRGDWPNIDPPGWDPSGGVEPSPDS